MMAKQAGEVCKINANGSRLACILKPHLMDNHEESLRLVRVKVIQWHVMANLITMAQVLMHQLFRCVNIHAFFFVESQLGYFSYFFHNLFYII